MEECRTWSGLMNNSTRSASFRWLNLYWQRHNVTDGNLIHLKSNTSAGMEHYGLGPAPVFRLFAPSLIMETLIHIPSNWPPAQRASKLRIHCPWPRHLSTKLVRLKLHFCWRCVPKARIDKFSFAEAEETKVKIYQNGFRVNIMLLIYDW